MKRIFVGGLSAETNEEDLREYFEQFGIVSAGVVVGTWEREIDKCTFELSRKGGKEGGKDTLQHTLNTVYNHC